MIVVCTLCYSDVDIPINEYLDLKPDDEYICPACEGRIRQWVLEQNNPDMIGSSDFEELNIN